jgi:hypothetical protein
VRCGRIPAWLAQLPLDRKSTFKRLVITSPESGNAAIVLSATAHAVYTFDRDQVTLDDVHDPVWANPQPVIVAAVKPCSRIRIGGQARYRRPDGPDAVLVSHIAARCRSRRRRPFDPHP